jgi:hypothetical protein
VLCLNVTEYMCVMSGFYRKVDENCTVVGDRAASSGKMLALLAV